VGLCSVRCACPSPSGEELPESTSMSMLPVLLLLLLLFAHAPGAMAFGGVRLTLWPPEGGRSRYGLGILASKRASRLGYRRTSGRPAAYSTQP
jgi:hypothetical protein